MIAERAGADDVVLETLRTLDAQACVVQPNRWALSLANGRAFDVDVVRCGDWLAIECRPEPDSLDPPWSLLEWNARFESGAKLLCDAKGLALRADVAVDDDEWAAGRLLDGCRAVRNAWAALHGGADLRPEAASPPGGEAASGDAPHSANLFERCAGAGWPGTERDGGALAVELEAPGFWQALVKAERSGIRAAVELAAIESSPVVRAATAGLLLDASGLIRFARAAVRGEADGPRASFEVFLGRDSQAGELRQALGALSVACRLWAHEVRAMQDESVAWRWLTAHRETSAMGSREKGEA